MAEPQFPALRTLVVEEEMHFTLGDLCRACSADRALLIALVDEGALGPTGEGPDDWRFSGSSLGRARTALRLRQDLELNVAGAALVLDLLDEIESLKSLLRRSARI
jgi:chaperone modulatory protein CbpM